MAINRNGADCSGCTACQTVCPKQCIKMKPDSLGFKYPKVDYSECIECGLCEKICPFNMSTSVLAEPEAYAGVNVNTDELLNSSSGAIFVSISDFILENGGVVYGAAYGPNLNVEHIRATNKQERDLLRGSKYVQSDLKSTIYDVISDLKNDRLVLFTGTPCQNAGVNAAVPSKYKSNLLLVDIICHGCPSPKVWNDYVSWFSKRHDGVELTYAIFRDKRTSGWKAYTELFYGDGSVYKGKYFINLFKKDIMLRKACGKCPFSSLNRPSDITIGDFWGYEKYKPSLNTNGLGVSLILVNTKKGDEYFNKFKTKIRYECVPLKYCLQRNLEYPTPLNPLSEEFAREFSSRGIQFVLRRYGDFGFINKLKIISRRIYRKIKRILK